MNPALGIAGAGHVLEVTIADADDEFDIGIGKCAKHVWIGVVELDSADVYGVEECQDSGRRGEIVGNLAVVDSNSQAPGWYY